MTAADATHLRPGIALGERPERSAEARARAVAPLDGWRRSRERWRAEREMAGAVAAIRARIDRLATASDARLDDQIREARNRLLVEGLCEPSIAEALPLIAEAAGRSLGQRPYDVQLMGAWLMASGMLVEMETGEGKTLATALTAATAALAGVPVHVMSANDYLVTRDAEGTRPLHARLGLEVGFVTEATDQADRRRAYRADIAYGTGKQIAFDYLRDRASPRSGSASAPEPMLRGLCFALVDEADSVMIDEARTPLVLSRSAPIGDAERVYKRALRLARALESPADFAIDAKRRRLTLTENGRAGLAARTASLSGIWRGPRRREEWVERALCALHLCQRDRDYLVRDDRVQIIDALTGRVSPDRSWGQGLHQLIELKEGCPLSPPSETLARISYQQFFGRYLRLAGTTGTAREVAAELGRAYGLTCVRVPTRRPSLRVALGTQLVASETAKWNIVVGRVRELRAKGRALLIGTGSVGASERLSELLSRESVPHRVLNAHQDADEAEIISRAGRSGVITVATSMAGRGTDIALEDAVAARGGLHVIATEPAESSRVDRQLYGRCARQGDPGSFEMVASLDDALLAAFFPLWLRKVLARDRDLARKLRIWLVKPLLWFAQRAEEGRHERMRSALAKAEEELGALLGFSDVRE